MVLFIPPYCSPRVEYISIDTEKGFASSGYGNEGEAGETMERDVTLIW